MVLRRKQQTLTHNGKGLIFVISGPSGCGKTTLIRSLLKDEDLKTKLVRSISVTTRPIRPGEREGADYFFISEAEFRRRLDEKKILEWTRYLHYYYGTPREYVEKQMRLNRSVALCLDTKGAFKLRKLYPGKVTTIFILPPSLKALQERIEKRRCNTASPLVQSRLRLAARELQVAEKYDYRVVNDNFTLALKRLKGTIIKELGLKIKS